MVSVLPARTRDPRLGRKAVWAGAAVVAALWLIAGLRPARHMSDYRVYRRAAQAVVHGVNVYADNGAHLQFTYPPFASDVVAPLAAPSLVAAAMIMTGLTICAGLWVTRHALRALDDAPWFIGPLLLVALMCTEPVRITTRLGQINLLLMALVMADATGHLRRLPRGVLTGVAIGVKLTPGVFLLSALAGGRRRAALVAGSVFAATVAIGALIQPEAARQYWTRLLWDSSRVGPVQWYGNQSLLGVFTRLVGPGTPARVLWLSVGAVALVVGLRVAVAVYRQGNLILAVGVVGVLSTLLSPISWTHHWVWCIAVFGGLVARAGGLRPGWSRLGWIGAALWLVVFEVGPNTRAAHLAFGWTPSRVLVGNDYVIAGLVLLAVLALRPSRRPSTLLASTSGPAAASAARERSVLTDL